MEFNNGKIMGSVLEKSLAIVELLVDYPEGLTVSAIAQATDQPASGVHRTLQELTRLGYVRQAQAHGDYALTIRMSAMGLGFLGRAGITDVAQPVLDRLAADCGELIRLSIIDGDDLIWVAVAQGGTRGLRYDPGQEQGVVVHLASAAGGLAWLSTMGDDEALTRATRGFVADVRDARDLAVAGEVADLDPLVLCFTQHDRCSCFLGRCPLSFFGIEEPSLQGCAQIHPGGADARGYPGGAPGAQGESRFLRRVPAHRDGCAKRDPA